MIDFKNKIAVITGASYGIGKALALECARKGMHVVVVDVKEDVLNTFAKEIKQMNTCPSVLAVQADVSSKQDMQELAQKVHASYGKVHLLFNNAGVILDKDIWEYEYEDWEWILGVDLYGVIYGVKNFLPLMEGHGEGAHIINTASIAGFITSPTIGAYKVAKHAVVAFTEELFYDLAAKNSSVHVSVLAPSWTNTNIRNSHEYRPERFINGKSTKNDLPESRLKRDQEVREKMTSGTDPKEVAEVTFQAIQENKFYIFPDQSEINRISDRMQTIINQNNPPFTPQ